MITNLADLDAIFAQPTQGLAHQQKRLLSPIIRYTRNIDRLVLLFFVTRYYIQLPTIEGSTMQLRTYFPQRVLVALSFVFAIAAIPACVWADGKVVPPRNYQGSLEEQAQEAIIIFHGSSEVGGAKEDLILKIKVRGKAENFAWVVPFPSEPKVAKEDPKLFAELFDYVEVRKYRNARGNRDTKKTPAANAAEKEEKVKVLSRQVVGEFEVAVVRENEQGGLNPWLEKEGFQTLDDADDVLKYYRDRGYVFACVKVSSQALANQATIESHPLRFSFRTGGRDGIYFPMKMTSLQQDPFDINLYVFYQAWLNDKLSQFGYRHRGFELNYRDWDTKECKPNAGKSWSLPSEDPFLSSMSHKLPKITKLFQKLHPGKKYYLTNIHARRVEPADIRQWNSDLWMFPYYTNRSMIPYDARRGGPAADAYPNLKVDVPASGRARRVGAVDAVNAKPSGIRASVVLLFGVLGVLTAGATFVYSRAHKRNHASANYRPPKPKE